jgi:plastocyanin
MRNSRAALATIVAAALLAAGCGGGGAKSSGSTLTVTAPAGGGTPTLTVEAHELYFSPKLVKAPAGKLQIHYVEMGTQQHTLVIDGVSGFKLEVGPGSRNATGTVTLKPGEYSYYCTIPGHRAAGMSGTITVAP